MQISFKQGIVQSQTSPSFVTLVGGNVNLNATPQTPTIVAFAFNNSNFLIIENDNVPAAWTGPFSNSLDYYLYWDVNQATGIRTFGSFSASYGFGNSFPSVPQLNEHFFYYPDNTMYYWNGSRWVSVLRVFAAKLLSGTILVPYGTGTQASLTQTINIGQILLDDESNPIKKANGTFVTTETLLNTNRDSSNSYKVETNTISAIAVETIPSFSCITLKGVNKIGLASYTNFQSPCMGVSLEDINKDNIGRFITQGIVSSANFNFTDPPNTALWVGLNGELTTTVPNAFSVQRVGHIVDSKTAYIAIREIILLS